MSLRSIVLLGCLVLTACSKEASGPSKADKVKLCKDTQGQMGGALNGDEKVYEAGAIRMALACAMACDAGDAASCATLDSEGYKYCTVAADQCKAACPQLKSASLDKSICGHLQP